MSDSDIPVFTVEDEYEAFLERCNYIQERMNDLYERLEGQEDKDLLEEHADVINTLLDARLHVINVLHEDLHRAMRWQLVLVSYAIFTVMVCLALLIF